MADGEILRNRIKLIDNVSDTIENIARNAENLENRMGALDDAISKVEDARIDIDTSNTGEQFEQVANAGEEAAEVVEGFGKSAEDTEEDAEGLGEGAKSAAKGVGELGNILSSLGIAVAIKEIGDSMMEASDKAAVFESAIAKVSTVADTNAVSMDKVKKDILALSADTGQGVNDLSEATYQAISASVDSAKAVEFTGTATKLATGGFTEAATAVDVVTTALNAYGLGAEKAESVSDMLITTQNLGKTSVDQLAQSVGKVIPLAAAYNVEMDNLSAAYAQLTKGGIATAESGTYLKSMLAELGDTSSDVGQTLIDMTGKSFNVLSQEGYSLGDVMEVLGQAVDNDTVKFSALWSSQEAGVGALALLNAEADEFNDTLEEMENSAGATNKAYEIMTNTTEHAKTKMVNATENISNAIGDGLNPALKKLYNTGANAFNWMADVIEEHPGISAALAGITTGVSVMGAGLAVLSTITMTEVIPSLNALKVAVIASPFVPWIIGAGILAGAVIGVATAVCKATEDVEVLTFESQKQAKEIKDLTVQYNSCKERLGENSSKAIELKTQLDELTESYEANKQSVEELFAETDKLVDKNNELIDSFEESYNRIVDEENESLGLAEKLSNLANETNATAIEQQEMEAIMTKLNKEFPELADNYSGTAQDATEYAEAAKKAAKEQANLNKYQEAVTQKTNLEANAEAIKEQIAALEKQRAGYIDPMSFDIETDIEGNVVGNMYANSDLSNIDNQIKILTESLGENAVALEGVNAKYAAMQAQSEQAIASATTSTDLLKVAGEQASVSIDNLRSKYDEAYTAAESSMQGQIGLFNDVKTASDLTVDEMMKKWKEQTEFMAKYEENLKKAQELGLDPTLIQELSDGSQESAGYLNQIVTEAEKAGGATSEVVKNLNEMYGKKQEGLKSWADTAANMSTDVQNAFNSVKSVMEASINNMNTSDMLKQEALNGVNGYVKGITDPKGLSNVAKGAGTVAETATKPLEDIDTVPTGENIDNGTIRGMENQRDALLDTARSICEDVHEIMNITLDIHSPSKRTMWTGEMVGLGLGEGMENTFGYVKDTAEELGEYGLGSFTPEQQEYMITGGKAVSNEKKTNVYLNVDMSGAQYNVSSSYDIKEIARELAEEVESQLYGAGEGVFA